MFPSPLGVIFSLIELKYWKDFDIGIGFRLLSELYSLLFERLKVGELRTVVPVSVSSRSYILSYLAMITANTPLSLVSVSSRSYILSY